MASYNHLGARPPFSAEDVEGALDPLDCVDPLEWEVFGAAPPFIIDDPVITPTACGASTAEVSASVSITMRNE
jgi:hypothetical protein